MTARKPVDHAAVGGELYEQFRPLIFSIAYRMLGSVNDAEDVVQETFTRFQEALNHEQKIESPRAYLATIATRASIDQLRRARTRREKYVGEWLPEPLLADPAPELAEHAETADSLSLAFLVLLESLTPVQRAVFLLHDVFEYDYHEIAPMIGKSEQNCRQIAVRARKEVDERKPRFETSRGQRDELAQRFFDAVEGGDADGLLTLLAADAEMHGDGGGKAPAWPRPFFGRVQVARVLRAGSAQLSHLGARRRTVDVNGQPGAIFFDRDGRVINVLALDIADGQVQTIRSIVNPDKLRHLGEPADLYSLLRQSKSGRAT